MSNSHCHANHRPHTALPARDKGTVRCRHRVPHPWGIAKHEQRAADAPKVSYRNPGRNPKHNKTLNTNVWTSKTAGGPAQQQPHRQGRRHSTRTGSAGQTTGWM